MLAAGMMVLTGCAVGVVKSDSASATTDEACARSCEAQRKSCEAKEDVPCEAQYEKCESACVHEPAVKPEITSSLPSRSQNRHL